MKTKKHEIKNMIFFSLVLGLLAGSIVLLIKKSFVWFLVVFLLACGGFLFFRISRDVLKESSRKRRLEEVFPDFLQLMSSNLRAGMTIDKAILLSSRPEFAPLDQEIFKIGKDLTTGKSVEKALLGMAERINSEKIKKTILLIISGISAGGDVAILLEQTATSMREREFIEKKAASNVLMYVIFIFLAVSIFAPALFSLSTVLVEVLTKILSGIPSLEKTSINIPLTLSKVNISVDFIKYFSIFFMVVIDFFASLTIGLVSKGEEKEGLKYFPVILILSFVVFFFSRILISGFLKGLL